MMVFLQRFCCFLSGVLVLLFINCPASCENSTEFNKQILHWVMLELTLGLVHNAQIRPELMCSIIARRLLLGGGVSITECDCRGGVVSCTIKYSPAFCILAWAETLRQSGPWESQS